MANALLRYPGAKWALAPRIVAAFPRHYHYIEPYAGSAAVFFTKQPSQHEVLNDISGDMINFLRVLRNDTNALVELIELTPWSRQEYQESDIRISDPVERARRYIVRCWQAHASDQAKKTGWRSRGIEQRARGMSQRWQKLPAQLLHAAIRLLDAEIDCRPALAVISDYNHSDVLLYVDPPYHPDCRTQDLYADEMTDADHSKLLDALESHTGSVALSGYSVPLYEKRLASWERFTFTALKAEAGASRQEVLWIKATDRAFSGLPMFEQ
jgi:DNA adenine methylase